MRKLARSTFNGVTFARKITSLVSFLFFFAVVVVVPSRFLTDRRVPRCRFGAKWFPPFFFPLLNGEPTTTDGFHLNKKKQKKTIQNGNKKKEQPGRGKRSWWGEKKNGVVCTRRYEKITLHMKVMKARGRGGGGGGA